MEIFKEFTFEAAHRLPHVPEGHKCARLHGHSFRTEIHVAGPLAAKLDWVMDFADINYLNEIPGLENPTSEAIARWIWKKLMPTLPGLNRVVVRETCTTGATYTKADE
jgi:6-pyruvoyltetrahydropterin/6-carboxytetrahydropterin synthase